MKIAKRAEQQNLTLDMHALTENDCLNLLSTGRYWFFKSNHYTSQDCDEWYEEGKPELRINCDSCLEVKVVLDDGYYRTVAITKTGTQLPIVL